MADWSILKENGNVKNNWKDNTLTLKKNFTEALIEEVVFLNGNAFMNTFTKIDRLLSLSFFYGFIAFSAHLWIPVMTNEAEVGTYTIQ